jgi:hypothetical protein
MLARLILENYTYFESKISSGFFPVSKSWQTGSFFGCYRHIITRVHVLAVLFRIGARRGFPSHSNNSPLGRVVLGAEDKSQSESLLSSAVADKSVRIESKSRLLSV